MLLSLCEMKIIMILLSQIFITCWWEGFVFSEWVVIICCNWWWRGWFIIVVDVSYRNGVRIEEVYIWRWSPLCWFILLIYMFVGWDEWGHWTIFEVVSSFLFISNISIIWITMLKLILSPIIVKNLIILFPVITTHHFFIIIILLLLLHHH